MRYTDNTFNSKNPVIRYAQRSRLTQAVKTLERINPSFTGNLLDIGSGNGKLCEMLATQFPNANIVCYEPVEWLRNEAKILLKNVKNVKIVSSPAEFSGNTFDYVFCLEVFEHLPLAETQTLFQMISSVQKPATGLCIISVPVEIYLPAFVKGVYRKLRSKNHFDARLPNIIMSILGIQIKNRPVDEIQPGIRYYFNHLGFDYRCFAKILAEHFTIIKKTFSPIAVLGPVFNSQVSFIVKAK